MRLLFLSAVLAACSTVPESHPDPADLAERVEALEREVDALKGTDHRRRRVERRRSVVRTDDVRELLTNELANLGRALLHRGPDGTYDGYRLSAIRRGSLPDRLGFHNGDIVHGVNGHPLISVEDAMQAYHELEDAETLVFELSRSGEPVELVVDVVEVVGSAE